MGNQLVIHCGTDETRVALIEHGLTSEFYVERRRDRGLVGNIYKGRVVRVLPGMQSAFVDIGLERTAFLYVGDVARPSQSLPDLDGMDDADDELPGAAVHDAPHRPSIDELLREGQEVTVQISKEPIGTKGARITTYISLPGRNVVYLPTVDHIGISRRITEDDERARLKTIAEEVRPVKGGLIVRTAGEKMDRDDLASDVGFLDDLWKDVRQRADVTPAPALVHRDLDLILRVTRDLLSEEFERVVIDSRPDFERLVTFVKRFMPALVDRVTLWEDEGSLFERYGIEAELSRALERKVWLKSGGTIVVDETEALTAIDVNTGRYVGKANLEETIVKINLEAVKEIAYQLRLRNIGGIIIIDFIDMETAPNRERVQQALVDALRADKARCNVLTMSELGLVEMTRKRVRESLRQTFTVPCFYCGGRGYLRSVSVIVGELLGRISKEAAVPGTQAVLVQAHPRVAEALLDEGHEALERVERRTGCAVVVKANDRQHFEQYEVAGKR